MWVAGIDEAGRGCICGALFVAGVIGREENIAHFGAKDSKKLSPKQRERIYQTLLESQHKGEIGLFVAQIEAWEIDKFGLSIAMKNGIEQILCRIADFATLQNLIGQNLAHKQVHLPYRFCYFAKSYRAKCGTKHRKTQSFRTRCRAESYRFHGFKECFTGNNNGWQYNLSG